MKIDMHFHVMPPSIIKELQFENPWNIRAEATGTGFDLRIGELRFALGADHFETPAILAAMDDMRLDAAAISPSPMLFQNRRGSLVRPRSQRHRDRDEHRRTQSRRGRDDLTPAEKEAILGGNARRLLGL